MTWQTHILALNNDAASLAAVELQGLLSESVKDLSIAVQTRAKRIEKYLNQLACGEIDKSDFDMLIADEYDLAVMEATKIEVEHQASMQRLADGIQTLLIKTISKAL